LKICDELMGLIGGKEKYVTILSCYVSPIGLLLSRNIPWSKRFSLGAMAETVDENGYLVPYPEILVISCLEQRRTLEGRSYCLPLLHNGRSLEQTTQLSDQCSSTRRDAPVMVRMENGLPVVDQSDEVV
jgi:hypothetical protein